MYICILNLTHKKLKTTITTTLSSTDKEDILATATNKIISLKETFDLDSAKIYKVQDEVDVMSWINFSINSI